MQTIEVIVRDDSHGYDDVYATVFKMTSRDPDDCLDLGECFWDNDDTLEAFFQRFVEDWGYKGEVEYLSKETWILWAAFRSTWPDWSIHGMSKPDLDSYLQNGVFTREDAMRVIEGMRVRASYIELAADEFERLLKDE